MRATLTGALMVALVLLTAGCNAEDRRPDLWLTGESAAWPGWVDDDPDVRFGPRG